MCVLLVRRGEDHQHGRWALPGTFLRERETLADAVLRCLREKAGISGRVPRQLQVFDDPARDDRGWVLSVAHVDVVPLAALEEALKSDGVRLASVTGEPELIAGLPYGHAEIVAKAVEWLRAAYAEAPDPGALLDEPFTLKDLRELHEAVAGETLDARHVPAVHGAEAGGDRADVRRDAGEAVAVVGAGTVTVE